MGRRSVTSRPRLALRLARLWGAALAGENAGAIRVAKLNVDENPVTASRFDVRSIPMLLVFKGGREVDRIVGVQPKSEIARRIERAIA